MLTTYFTNAGGQNQNHLIAINFTLYSTKKWSVADQLSMMSSLAFVLICYKMRMAFYPQNKLNSLVSHVRYYVFLVKLRPAVDGPSSSIIWIALPVSNLLGNINLTLFSFSIFRALSFRIEELSERQLPADEARALSLDDYDF